MEKLKNHNNLGLKILSVGIAILVWLLVTNTNDPLVTRRFTSIEVKVINEDALIKQGYAYTITEGDEVNVTLKGKASIVNALNLSDVRATADLSKTTQWGSVPIDISVGKYTEQVEIALGSINTMKVEIEESTTMSIPVNVVTIGQAIEGHAVGTTSCTPNLITVSGPKSMLRDAKEIRATVDITDVSSDVSKTCIPVLFDSDGKEIDNSQIHFEDTSIIASVSIWKTKEVPVKLQYYGSPDEDYVMTSFAYEPKKILVAAPEPTLNELKEITLEEISLQGLTNNLERDIDLNGQGVLPSRVVVADDSEHLIKVKASIEKIVTKTLTIKSNALNIKNKAGYKVSYKDSAPYKISIEGAKSVVNKVTVEDLKPWIDLNDCTGEMEGDHEIRVHVKELKGITVDDTSLVRIEISQ